LKFESVASSRMLAHFLQAIAVSMIGTVFWVLFSYLSWTGIPLSVF